MGILKKAWWKCLFVGCYHQNKTIIKREKLGSYRRVTFSGKTEKQSLYVVHERCDNCGRVYGSRVYL